MENSMKRIAIHGVPRSGTSWIGEIFNSSPCIHYRYQPLFSYAHKGFLGRTSSIQDIDEFFDRLLKCNDSYTTQREKRTAGILPDFKKSSTTHVAYKETQFHDILFNLLRRSENLTVFAIIRSPLSVISSWFKAPREFRSDLGWSEKEEWWYAPKKNMNKPELFYGFERWKDASSMFLHLKQQFPDRVCVIKYSNLLEHTEKETERMFDFCNLEYSSSTEEFISQSARKQNHDPYSVFRLGQKDDKWKQELDPDIIKKIRANLQGTPLEEYL